MWIYLAARYSRRAELVEYCRELEAMGHRVTSRWLDGGHRISDEELRLNSISDTQAKSEQFANEDFEDVISADLVISFTEEPRTTTSRGGRHVEFGIALGRMLRVWIVGPRENVFHCMEDVQQFATWEDARQAIECETPWRGPEHARRR